MTKQEYIREFLDQDVKCWCCGDVWDDCECEFYDTTVRCAVCDKCELHCMCIKIGGAVFGLCKKAASGEISTKAAIETIEKHRVGKKSKVGQ